VAALHTLSCDRCKTGACRPAGALVLAPGLHLLRGGPDAHVRHSSRTGRAVRARERRRRGRTGLGSGADASSAVRKKAGIRRVASSTAAPGAQQADSLEGEPWQQRA
jgi:hypothetical protein